MASGGSRCGFDAASAFLQHFVIGLGGRQLSIAPLGMAPRDQAYTDTASIFCRNVSRNSRVRRQFHPLQTDCGAPLGADPLRHLAPGCGGGAQPWASAPRVMAVFNALECLRLDACIARDLPGLARQMDALAYRSEDHRRQWQALAAELGVLARPGATALDSIGLLESCFDKGLPA